MLEFQKDFFEQEVRDGFYIDPTMKTVWAAELELLQKVAEICERHGIVWFAAYGTLLGAVRHEGFIPWDDDMDIWVRRKDYNRLLQLLPLELPAGYEVRSPLTKAGYDQFNMLVNNGGFSMEERHLKEYHGCPFSVGLDIFPLDCLPRDKNHREMQKNLVMLATRGAQVAGLIHLGQYDGEDPAEKERSLREEIWEGIHYLEGCGAKIDHRLVEREEWLRVASEFGRWGNYFAMMYDEEESDYLVNYVDYVRWPYKIFSKEYFSETYSASFEGFMLPIPCGYEQVLRRIYGAYEVLRKSTGTHDYPGYVRQICQLRDRMKGEDQWWELLRGMIPAFELFAEEDRSLPAAWREQLIKAGSENKRKILLIYECGDEIRNGECMVNELEKALERFESVQAHILLWWRPQKDMSVRLSGVSPELARRYQTILENYKRADWGICDETDNVSRAAEWCDVYYGDASPALQLFQRDGKPVMLVSGDD